jgi:hypothetical protein
MKHFFICAECKFFERYWQTKEEKRKRRKQPNLCGKYISHNCGCPQQSAIDDMLRICEIINKGNLEKI